MERFLLTLGLIMALMGMVSVPFQLNIVDKLRKKGIDSSIFVFLPSDIKNYKQIMDLEKNDVIKDRMKINFYGFVVSSTIAILSFLIILIVIFF